MTQMTNGNITYTNNSQILNIPHKDLGLYVSPKGKNVCFLGATRWLAAYSADEFEFILHHKDQILHFIELNRHLIKYNNVLDTPFYKGLDDYVQADHQDDHQNVIDLSDSEETVRPVPRYTSKTRRVVYDDSDDDRNLTNYASRDIPDDKSSDDTLDSERSPKKRKYPSKYLPRSKKPYSFHW
jgi:hypothetical protein